MSVNEKVLYRMDWDESNETLSKNIYTVEKR